MTTAPAGRDRAPAGRPALELLTTRAGRRLDVAFDALPIGVLVVTPGADRANAELRRIARIDEDQTLDGRGLEARLRPIDPLRRSIRRTGAPAAVRPVSAALAGTDWPSQRAALERGDGTTAVVRVIARPLVLPDGPGAVVTVVDETAMHEVERLRDAFLGIVGHELRSPISSILGAAELIRDHNLPPDIRTELTGDLGDEARRLHELVEQLIRLADLRRIDHLGDEPTHLPHLVRARIARWRARQPRLRIRLELPRGSVPAVAGDAGYVAQALDIVLDNAVKYAGVEAPLIVRIEAGGDELRLHVLDQGPGFPTADASRLFGLFWRAAPTGRSTADRPAGNGIGLFVMRSIVEGLGGRVWATNQEAGGADVGFALPIAPG